MGLIDVRKEFIILSRNENGVGPNEREESQQGQTKIRNNNVRI